MKENDSRVRRTCAAIKETVKQMICEMDAGKITVKELTDRAGIHRKTFYLHYAYIEALLEELLQEVLDSYSAQMDRLEVPFYITDTNRVFFEFFAAQEPYVEKMMCDPSYRSYCDALLFRSLAHNRQRFDTVERYSAAMRNVIDSFMVNGTLNIYRQWIADGKAIPLEEIIWLSGSLLEQGVRSIR